MIARTVYTDRKIKIACGDLLWINAKAITHGELDLPTISEMYSEIREIKNKDNRTAEDIVDDVINLFKGSES